MKKLLASLVLALCLASCAGMPGVETAGEDQTVATATLEYVGDSTNP